jgi:hypothetical protein
MGAFYETIPENLISWILSQKMFWVATAPLSPNGHINVSPKGGPYFGVDSPSRFWYQELTGSGNETMSHLYEPHNARICIMLCAFEGSPRILRLWGRGKVLESGSAAFDEFVREHEGGMEVIPGTRSVIVVEIEQVGTSCGFSVPFYEFKGHRDVLNELWRKKVKRIEEGKESQTMPKYWAYKNAWSMDGLPGMKVGTKAAEDFGVKPIVKMVGRAGENLAYAKKGLGQGRKVASLEEVLLVALVCLMLGALLAVQGPALLKQVQGVAVGEAMPSLIAWSSKEI